jgi:hypothetical protein
MSTSGALEIQSPKFQVADFVGVQNFKFQIPNSGKAGLLMHSPPMVFRICNLECGISKPPAVVLTQLRPLGYNLGLGVKG